VDCYRVGASFETADATITGSDVLGISSHFSFESGIVKDFIEYSKKLNPEIKIMVGGADVKARPNDYLNFGADLVFAGDFNPQEFKKIYFEKQVIPEYRHRFEKLAVPSFEFLKHLNLYSDSHDGPVPSGVSSPIGFVYFTRGCPRNCDFCESRLSRYEPLDLDAAIKMLKFYKQNGVKTLNIVDDNLLIQTAGKTAQRKSNCPFQDNAENGVCMGVSKRA
jgi:radical SAM superfamily enzyme YgiQ (UPF0313 family)